MNTSDFNLNYSDYNNISRTANIIKTNQTFTNLENFTSNVIIEDLLTTFDDNITTADSYLTTEITLNDVNTIPKTLDYTETVFSENENEITLYSTIISDNITADSKNVSGRLVNSNAISSYDYLGTSHDDITTEFPHLSKLSERRPTLYDNSTTEDHIYSKSAYDGVTTPFVNAPTYNNLSINIGNSTTSNENSEAFYDRIITTSTTEYDNSTTEYYNLTTQSNNLTDYNNSTHYRSTASYLEETSYDNLITEIENSEISSNISTSIYEFITAEYDDYLTTLNDGITTAYNNVTSELDAKTVQDFVTSSAINQTITFEPIISPLNNETSRFTLTDFFTNIATESMEPIASELFETVACKFPSIACNSTLQESYCFNGGTCCHHEHTIFCACPEEFEGSRCMRFRFMETLESSEKKLKMTLFSSVTSLFIAIVCLAILLFVVIMAWKKLKKRNVDMLNRTHALDSEILFVQGELEKLPASEKMNRLAKLSKIVEATARAAILSFPSLVSPQPFNPNKHPLSMARSSSEPTELNYRFQKIEMEPAVPRAKSTRQPSKNGMVKMFV